MALPKKMEVELTPSFSDVIASRVWLFLVSHGSCLIYGQFKLDSPSLLLVFSWLLRILAPETRSWSLPQLLSIVYCQYNIGIFVGHLSDSAGDISIYPPTRIVNIQTDWAGLVFSCRNYPKFFELSWKTQKSREKLKSFGLCSCCQFEASSQFSRKLLLKIPRKMICLALATNFSSWA